MTDPWLDALRRAIPDDDPTTDEEPMTLTPTETASLVERVRFLATVRNRDVDREPRTITLSEDECLALLGLISPSALAELNRTPGR